MTNAQSVKAALLLAATQLKVRGFDNEPAKLEAQLLLQHALNVNRAWLIAHEHENLPPSIHAAYSQVGWGLDPTRNAMRNFLRVGNKVTHPTKPN